MGECLECGVALPPPPRNGGRRRIFCSKQHRNRFNKRGRDCGPKSKILSCMKCGCKFSPVIQERTCLDCSDAGRLTEFEMAQINVPLACKLCAFGVRSKVAASGWECRGGVDGGGCLMQCRPWSQRYHYEPRRMTA